MKYNISDLAPCPHYNAAVIAKAPSISVAHKITMPFSLHSLCGTELHRRF